MKSKIFQKRILPIFVLLLCLPVQPVFCEETKIRVALAHWPPWKIINQGKFGGIDVEILKVIGTYLNISFEFSECPWRRCLDMVKNGEVDMITSFGKTPEREKYVYYLEPPYALGKIVFYTKKAKGPLIRQYEDLYKEKIGSLKGSVYFEAFDNDSEINKTEVTWEHQFFRMLSSGRISVIIGYETVTDYLIITEGFQGQFEKAPLSYQSTGSHFAMSKKSKATELIPQFNRVIGQMAKTHEFDDIINSFLNSMEQPGE
ncbi:substrate-binding periplasmic protein [Desulfonema magnum]|nr:transporter substrate-binding domain-containing protein [Desulfonema magnum]